ISGTVFNDANRNGVQDAGESGIAGRTVEVLDPNGTVVAMTTTDANGNYRFDNLHDGLEPAVTYRVVEVLPSGVVRTTPNPPAITFTRGRTVSHVDFGNARRTTLSSSTFGTGSAGTGGSFGGDPGVGAGPLDGSGLVDVVNALQAK